MATGILDKFRRSSSDKMPNDFQRILDLMRGNIHNQPDEDMLWRAYEFGKNAHKDQMRKSGEPYFNHCVAVATILAEMHLDSITVAAALLHDVVEDTGYTLSDVETHFGKEVAQLVDGVTKLSDIKFRSEEDKQAVNFRKMLLSVAEDIRTIIIKFADRLHNMRTIEHLPDVKARRIARETRDVYVPLAHRLGMYRLRSEMDDLVFKILEPKAYQELSKSIPKRQNEFESYIKKFLVPVRERIESAGIQTEYRSRFKNYSSIHRKMVTQKRPLQDIYDIFAIRIIVNKLEDCYSVLGFVHSFYPPIQARFKDFIATPKANGYQSLHTTVIGPGGRPVEVQIRTEEMDQTAEEGVAAHWRYKENEGEGVRRHRDDLDAHVSWLRNLVEILQNEDSTTSHQFMDLLKIDLYKNEIFVFTPKGDVRILPLGATPLDFAFDIHTQVGLHCIGAKVNGKIVPLSTQLKSGDSLEIITSDHQTPNAAWLKFVKTSKAKSNIRKWAKKQEFDHSVKLGQEILERELRRLRLSKEAKKIRNSYGEIGYDSEDKMLAAIGSGHRTITSLLNKIYPDLSFTPPKVQKDQNESFFRRARRNTKGVTIAGIDNVMITFGKCCNPIPGDPIIGFITRGRGVTVHRTDCDTVGPNLTEKERLIEVQWGGERNQRFLVRLKVMAQDRKHFLRDLTERISSFDVNIESLTMKAEEDLIVGLVVLEVDGVRQLDKIRNRILMVDGVISVERE